MCVVDLDRDGRIGLRPDLSWWGAGRCRFVGDVKHKPTSAKGVLHPDLYQLLAYTIATGLPAGLLVYAAGECDEAEHVVELAGKTLHVRVLDLRGSPSEILTEVGEIAGLVRRLAAA
jgi:5-methylcytosine-specific restriction enzyme subunit McrC